MDKRLPHPLGDFQPLLEPVEQAQARLTRRGQVIGIIQSSLHKSRR